MTTFSDGVIDPHHAIIVGVKGDPPSASPTRRIELDLSRFQSGRWAMQLDGAFVHGRAPAVILARVSLVWQ